MGFRWLTLLVLLLVTGLGTSSAAAGTPASNDYSKQANWLCLPGRQDSCAATLTATVISPRGDQSKRSYPAEPAAPIDCFYVYPTVSREQQPNSDMVAGPDERRAVTAQFARFAAKCRTFAPLYRQVTLAGLQAAMSGHPEGIDGSLPYHDLLDAWHYYLEHDNHGRGVILIGHDQGARILTRLIASEVDGRSLQKRIVSAMLIGTDIQVPIGKDLGATFRHMPLCRFASQTGCVIAYSSFLDDSPPDAGARFAASGGNGLAYACVNPQYLLGDSSLEAELPPLGSVAVVFDTTFFENPGLLSARCVSEKGFSYLAISVAPGEVGRKIHTAMMTLSQKLPGWGLHVFDINLALGDLVDIAGMEARSWMRGHPPN